MRCSGSRSGDLSPLSGSITMRLQRLMDQWAVGGRVNCYAALYQFSTDVSYKDGPGWWPMWSHQRELMPIQYSTAAWRGVAWRWDAYGDDVSITPFVFTAKPYDSSFCTPARNYQRLVRIRQELTRSWLDIAANCYFSNIPSKIYVVFLLTYVPRGCFFLAM